MTRHTAPIIRAAVRLDPDFDAVHRMVVDLVRHAFNRGAVSWVRRNEMLDHIDTLMDVGTYELSSDDPSVVVLGVYAEPSFGFLSEIGMVPEISSTIWGRP